MKYKVLLTGNNKMVINEFFTYMDFSFECFSTSDRYDDIINHVKYIHPDVLVYCLYGEHPDDLKRFVNVERKISQEGIPIAIVGDADECDQFERVAPLMDVSIFRRPISSQKLEEAVISLLKEKRPEPDRGSRSVTLTESTLKTEDVMRLSLHAEKRSSLKMRPHIILRDDAGGMRGLYDLRAWTVFPA